MFYSFKDRVIRAVVLGVIGGATFNALTVLWLTGVKSSDIFALIGSLVGAVATAAGAVWLADRTTHLKHEGEAEIVRTAAEALQASIQTTISLIPPGEAGWNEFRKSTHRLQIESAEVPAIMREALAHGTALNFRQRVKIIKAEASIHSFQRFYDDCNSEGEFEYWDECLVEVISVLTPS